MSVRSASRGSPAASSIRLALRTSSIVATRRASFVRWVLRCFGRRRLSSSPKLPAISVMPSMMRFQGPPRADSLNHTPTRHVNNLLLKLIGGKIESINENLGMKEVSNISLKFTNVAVMEISSENLYEISQNKLAAGSHCDVEINNLLRARQFVCQGQSILRASANYNVDVQSSGVTNASSEIDDEKSG